MSGPGAVCVGPSALCIEPRRSVARGPQLRAACHLSGRPGLWAPARSHVPCSEPRSTHPARRPPAWHPSSFAGPSTRICGVCAPAHTIRAIQSPRGNPVCGVPPIRSAGPQLGAALGSQLDATCYPSSRRVPFFQPKPYCCEHNRC